MDFLSGVPTDVVGDSDTLNLQGNIRIIYKEKWGKDISCLIYIHDHETRAAGLFSWVLQATLVKCESKELMETSMPVSQEKACRPLALPKCGWYRKLQAILLGIVPLILSGLWQPWTAIEAEMKYCPFWVKTLGRGWRDSSTAKSDYCIKSQGLAFIS